MGVFFAYIVKSTVCLALFYLFYRLLLSRDTFHRFNRIALLSLIGLSVVIPLIRISTEKATAIQSPVLNLEELLLLAVEGSAASSPSLWMQAALLVYIGGVLFFTFRLLYSGGRIIRIIRSGERVKTDLPVSLIITGKEMAPFSWMNHIVISRKDWEESRDEILTHEMAHIRYRHSWDVLLSGICVIFHWFNPASWLLKQELQNIHEYEADENVLNQGIDAKRYQLLLIKKAVGTQRFTSMANSFNHSKLKKRITMMLKSKSNAWGRLKYLYVLPLAAVTIAAFARPEISRELDKISSTKVSELPLIKEVIPLKIDPPITVRDTTFIVKSDVDVRKVQVEVEKAIKDARIEETVQKAVEEANIEETVRVAIETAKVGETVQKAIQEAKIEETVQKVLEEENVQRLIKESMEEKKKEAAIVFPQKIPDNTVYMIDGVESTHADVEALNPKDIDRIEIFKDKEVDETGKKAGVIYITTKK